MSLFRRDDSGAAPVSVSATGASAPRRESRNRVTHISAGTRVTGEISGSTEVLIDGEVDGEVRVDHTVVVGAEGRVRGEISARMVRVGGTVSGNLRGSERVEVLPTGSTEGDISAPRVVIAEGAFFKGTVEMTAGKGGGSVAGGVRGGAK